MSFINIISIQTEDKTSKIIFEASEDLEKYFNKKNFDITYSINIEKVPNSVLVIPFVCNVLPIIWLSDAELNIPELDKDFFESIETFKQGYVDMSPMLSFKGKVNVAKTIDNSFEPDNCVAAFFSGGVDAFDTLITHIAEKPILITLWGADIKLSDTKGWETVENHLNTTADTFGLKAISIKTNFREFISDSVGDLITKSPDSYYHGYQHGIGIISHAAPVAYLHKLKTTYIASSYTYGVKAICASDPTIDNHIKLCSCSIFHDRYESNRQEKIQNIVNWAKTHKTYPFLRVCWVVDGGYNCGKCEKCIRTKYGIMAEGESPDEYGIPSFTEDHFSEHNFMKRAIRYMLPQNRYSWKLIQNRFHETQAYRDLPRVAWIYNFDTNTKVSLLNRIEDIVKLNIYRIHRVIKSPSLILRKLGFERKHTINN